MKQEIGNTIDNQLLHNESLDVQKHMEANTSLAFYKTFILSLLLILCFSIYLSCSNGENSNSKKIEPLKKFNSAGSKESNKKKLKLKAQFVEFNTSVNISVYDVSPKDKERVSEQIGNAEFIFEYFNREMNPSLKTSALYKLNNNSKPNEYVPIPNSLKKVLKESYKLTSLTDATFDIALFPVVEKWGFLVDENPVKPDSAELNELMAKVTMNNILTDKPDSILFKNSVVKLGLGAIAKGLAVDSVANYFRESGLTEFIIEAGGDLKVVSDKGKTVAVRRPREGEGFLDTLRVKHLSVATSGDYEKFFFDESGNRWFHIINPKTGYSDSDLISVTIVIEEAYMADALATSVFVMGIEKGRKYMKDNNLRGILAYLNKEDGSVVREEINIESYKLKY